MVPPDAPTVVRVKRLTLDLPVDLHRALKVRSAELAVPMVEVLRVLIQRALDDPVALSDLAAELGGPLHRDRSR